MVQVVGFHEKDLNLSPVSISYVDLRKSFDLLHSMCLFVKTGINKRGPDLEFLK